jgi:3-hydroxyacyl-CoA dehydrogenase
MSQTSLVELTRDGDIAAMTVNNPPVNTIGAAVRGAVEDTLQKLESQTGVKAVILRCAGSTFFSGADISEFSGPPQEEAYRVMFFKLENLEVPLIAAMHGTVLGGGLEIALACHYRIAVPGTRFGFPEVTLGIIPGAGGTQRMPRLIGVDNTLDLILSAKPVDAQQGLELGFIDAVVEGDLLQSALAYARKLVSEGKGPRRTSERKVDPATGTAEIIEKMKARAKQEYPNRVAPFTAIEAVRASITMPLQQGLEYETKLVNEAKVTTESKAAVHVFFAERETRRIPGLPADVKARLVRKAGVIGAGTMGGGIAMCFANAGIPVTVIDASREALDRGLGVVNANYESMVKRGRLSAEDKTKRMALISGELDYNAIKDADVVIEAVFESMPLKKEIFGKLDHVVKQGAVLATNTSALDVEEIAKSTQRPQDVIGTHFFSPANVMPLLEVVRTDLTSAETLRTVLDMSKPLKKTPVVAKVCYGFIGNRMMEGYAREAERMVLEGATPRQVDDALQEWGMAMGILAVFDMAGIDVGVNVHKANADRYPPDPTYYQADMALYEAGRLGQKTGKGYYRYQPGDRNRYDDPEALAIIKARAQQLGIEQKQHSKDEILERCLYPLLNEGIRILEEGVALRASDIDVVWTSGYGFPRYRGGPLFYASTIGLKTLLDGILEYQKQYGPMHWTPAPLLVELVKQGKTIEEWERSKR